MRSIQSIRNQQDRPTACWLRIESLERFDNFDIGIIGSNARHPDGSSKRFGGLFQIRSKLLTNLQASGPQRPDRYTRAARELAYEIAQRFYFQSNRRDNIILNENYQINWRARTHRPHRQNCLWFAVFVDGQVHSL